MVHAQRVPGNISESGWVIQPSNLAHLLRWGVRIITVSVAKLHAGQINCDFDAARLSGFGSRADVGRVAKYVLARDVPRQRRYGAENSTGNLCCVAARSNRERIV